ncbi:bifunctional Delta(1)-pyrroline-2-carboxylate/Delta(1)-piperideine-2-carboxylate reductase [Paracraurococcus ruber]|uniref:Ornithine cyclodeaminase n=1 Tax=Paracraurococcus ruber TaxID=77675 RepID=A0ABS1CXP1_9PROT|nr:ornithine cyclodeaminase family protein [Paracraurococcus ruber]MBK1659090.1 hypothetical protein [Paracraurococcus ruber]TDG32538.1 ornithine cyclodeaminase family protein [Paracraurococcus ruber]
MAAATTLPVLDAAAVAAALPYPRLIAALRAAFAAATVQAPPRANHRIPVPGAPDGTLLVMPAWEPGGPLGVKLVTVFPGNAARGEPALHSTYLLSDAVTGRPQALLDGNEITGRRTAAVSALAADLLAPPGAEVLLLLGAGHIAGMVPAAMRAVRPIRRVLVWNPRPARAEALAARLGDAGFAAEAVADARAAAAEADIVSCATLATAPILAGAWLRPGAHLDLIGGFAPGMREADSAAFARAAHVAVDNPAALAESGDLIAPLAEGVLRADAVAPLGALCRGEAPGRTGPAEITVFKSVGTALADLTAARLVAGG